MSSDCVSIFIWFSRLIGNSRDKLVFEGPSHQIGQLVSAGLHIRQDIQCF